ncbi:MAG TPA: hypothetical protein VE397_21140, partial [Stellaceae bacterium]|nr:hypothetical protein [Stellaceae bacterium]
MSASPPFAYGAEPPISRRSALTGLALATAFALTPTGQASGTEGFWNGLGPGFSPSGPNAGRYGADEGYPIADRSLAVQPGEP